MTGDKTNKRSAVLQTRSGDRQLLAKLKKEIEGEVLFDAYSRGRYSTDASIYQIQPIGVVVAKHAQDVVCAIQIAAEHGIAILPRGAGTSQIGQTVAAALVIDTSKYMKQIHEFDQDSALITVEPGLVLDHLNAYLKPQGLFYPIDVSTGNRATLGGMAGNNSCGARSILYGNMVHNVNAIDAVLADGSCAHFASVTESGPASQIQDLVARLIAIGQAKAEEIQHRFPKLLRRVGGYNIDELVNTKSANLARLLVGSEGTLAFFTQLQLQLQKIPSHKVLAVCHFPSFYQAMAATQHIVKLKPSAVELVDNTMIQLAQKIPLFSATVKQFVRGQPQALLLVEFCAEDFAELKQSLAELQELMNDLGFVNSVVQALENDFQAAIWEVRKAGLNIMMSMKGDGKPVSFIEDCAVALEDLADYTRRLDQVFAKYGTKGTWYAHASVGCLHVRPILNMKTAAGAKVMRAIMEETLEIVQQYKGSHSGEHGDGLARSEFHPRMFGESIMQAFAQVKHAFDAKQLFNPGKIVNAARMDDRTLFRYHPNYKILPLNTVLDWSDYGSFAAAIEMCNNNGACRKTQAGVMCPSFRVTADEQHLTRGRANTLRLAISGQLGQEALSSKEMFDTMDLCVSCKACRRECPTGIDMAKMKLEFLQHYYSHHRLPWRKKLIAYLPRYAPRAAKFARTLNLRDRLPGIAWLSEKILGLSANRQLPSWSDNYFNEQQTDLPQLAQTKAELVLLVDTFNRYYEPENIRAAIEVLSSAGHKVLLVNATDSHRPLCCGRTFLAAGMLEQARQEAIRMLTAFKPFVQAGIPIVGLEPSCLLTLRDEFKSLVPGAESTALSENAFLLEEYLLQQRQMQKLDLPMQAAVGQRLLVHGHCHQKSFATMPAMQQVLAWLQAESLQFIESSCCGMAGAFGYEAEHYQLSMAMAATDLLPALQKHPIDTTVIANGFSCRHQISHASHHQAQHMVCLLRDAIKNKTNKRD